MIGREGRDARYGIELIRRILHLRFRRRDKHLRLDPRHSQDPRQRRDAIRRYRVQDIVHLVYADFLLLLVCGPRVLGDMHNLLLHVDEPGVVHELLV